MIGLHFSKSCQKRCILDKYNEDKYNFVLLDWSFSTVRQKLNANCTKFNCVEHKALKLIVACPDGERKVKIK